MKKTVLIILAAFLLVTLLATAAAAQTLRGGLVWGVRPGLDPWLFAPGRFGFTATGDPVFLFGLRRHLSPFGLYPYGGWYPYGGYPYGYPYGQPYGGAGGWEGGEGYPGGLRMPRPGEFVIPPPGFGPTMVDPFAFQRGG